MQSFIQYRRFKRHLEQQIKRHGVQDVAAPVNDRPAGIASSNLHRTQLPRSHYATPDHAPKEKELESGGEPGTRILRTDTPLSQHRSLSTAIAQPLSQAEVDTTDHAILQHDRTGDESGRHQSTASTNVGDDISSEAGYETEADDEDGAHVRQTGTRLGQTMTGISVRSKKLKDEEAGKSHVFVVGFQGQSDPLNPHNWPNTRRWIYTFIIAFIGLIVGFASSVDSAAATQAAAEFGVSEVVESLATGLYLVGFGCGAFIAGPLSETVGRNPVYLTTGGLFMIFVMASGLAPNIGAQLAFRFLAGFFGSTPLTCAGGSLSDMWSTTERTKTFPVFANAAFIGPILGPVMGGFIGESSAVSWRWCEWVTLIWSGLIFATVFLILPETYAPVLLKWKAQHLRELTGDNRYKSALEVQDTRFLDRVMHNLYRPWLLLFFEPIAILFTLYLSVVYIVLFTFLTGYEFIFEETYGLSQGITFLIFLALGVGFISASMLVPFIVKRYQKNFEKAKMEGKNGLPPEQRLIFAMIGAPFLPIGIFWMGWTAYPSVSVWSPIVANLFVGFGIISVFISTYQYLIDAFEAHAASALVGLTFVRYMAAGGMIPVSIPFYKNLGVHWTLTVLGAISALMVPVPYIFYVFGERIRGKSRYAVGKQTN